MILSGAVSIILLFGAVYVMADAIRRARWVYALICAANLVTAYLLLQFLMRDADAGSVSAYCILPLAIVTAAEFVLFWNMRRYKNAHVTPMSVKEGMDQLSDGLCYYYEDGRIRLANHTMYAIASDILGVSVIDGTRFFEHLRNGECLTGTFLQKGEEPIFRVSNGNVYSFKKKTLEMDGKAVTELIATDITDDLELQEKLNEKNERLRGQKRRLLDMNVRIIDLTIEKEILQAKMNIHDDLGKSLIAIKQYLSGDLKREELLPMLKTDISLLDAQENVTSSGDYSAVFKAAGDVGIKVEVCGKLPDDEDRREIVSAALRECITNTFRHAGGDTLFVDLLREEDGSIIAEFSNNGKAPAGEIKESGGLKSLRDLAEQKGAVMSVESIPQFCLRIEMLPVLKKAPGEETKEEPDGSSGM